MAEGFISTLLADRGFAFIARGGGLPDLFLHCSAMPGVEFGTALLGERVSFEVIEDERSGKPRAANVRLLKEDS